MKTEITETGWKETTVKHFKIVSVHRNPFNITAKVWLESNEKLRLKKGMRSYCSCCHTPWKDLTGDLNCVMTDKGNQAVCDNCFNKLEKDFNKCH